MLYTNCLSLKNAAKVIFALSLLYVFCSTACAKGELVIKDVKVRGNQKFETMAIMKNINSKVGDIFDTSVAAADSKRIARLKGVRGCHFDTVNIDGQLSLIFTVNEYEYFNSIKFFGNQKFNEDTLRRLLSFKQGSRLSIMRPAADKRNIIDFYRSKGFKEVKVCLNRELLAKGKVVYTIEEGSKTRDSIQRHHMPGESKNCSIAVIGDYKKWSNWRSAPLNFPTYINPSVPETLEGGPAVNFGPNGEDLAVIVPNYTHEDKNQEALFYVAYRLRLPETVVTDVMDLTENLKRRNIIMLGTLENNPLIKQVLDSRTDNFWDGISHNGYKIQVIENPWSQGKRIILAVGYDDIGAWQAATVMQISRHGKVHTGKVGKLKRWPTDLPEGYFWAPFEAAYSGCKNSERLNITPNKKFVHPRVPFGVRCWGSPTPKVETFGRMLKSLKKFGVNAVVVQPGGWPDLKNPGPVCKGVLDQAYNEGISVRFYVGNEERSHYPAELSEGHKKMTMAIKDHPALAAWRLYNQLESDMTEEERGLVKKQIQWLGSISNKPIGMEVAWGHDTGPIPEDKRALIDDLLKWGGNEIAHDYAPIGGWSKKHQMDLWEQRLQDLEDPFAILQAHVPFTEPTIPTAAELRNQYWWSVVGGAKGFFFEAAYVYTHFSNRGLLGWDLEPLPDGRIQEVERLSHITKKIEDMIINSKPASVNEVQGLNFEFLSNQEEIAVRFRTCPDAVFYLILINKNLTRPAEANFSLNTKNSYFKITQLTPEIKEYDFGKKKIVTENILPGGGACFMVQHHK